tara:strand:- start:10 stop:246 length:237 start_codon:yes stop_codon:yes gene_type:complete
MSKIENIVCAKITQRAALGKDKYGTTMERDDLTPLEWLIHAQEEAMDLAVYLEKLIQNKLLVNEFLDLQIERKKKGAK